MTNTAPRTRRQLHEALKAEKYRADQLEHSYNTATRVSRAESITRSRAEIELRKLGFQVVNEYNERLECQTQHFKAPDELPAVTQARRETLEKVIDALGIKGYANGGTFHLCDSSKSRTSYDTVRLWSDIETALEVRAERKLADQRQATAEKVAGLTKPKPFENAFSFTFVPTSDDFDPAAPKVNDLTPAPKKSKKSKPNKGAAK